MHFEKCVNAFWQAKWKVASLIPEMFWCEHSPTWTEWKWRRTKTQLCRKVSYSCTARAGHLSFSAYSAEITKDKNVITLYYHLPFTFTQNTFTYICISFILHMKWRIREHLIRRRHLYILTTAPIYKTCVQQKNRCTVISAHISGSII